MRFQPGPTCRCRSPSHTYTLLARENSGPIITKLCHTLSRMKLYTRTGDDGTTGLFGGVRVPKNHPRVEAYGDVDELNATIGLAIAVCSEQDVSLAPMRSMLITIQARLFEIGADLATPPDSGHESKITRINASQVTEAEAWIDQIEAANEPMKTFVLPGGTELAARLHLARAVCRRAERRIVSLAATDDVTPHTIVYVNRISDLLFAMARRANGAAGVADMPWPPANENPA